MRDVEKAHYAYTSEFHGPNGYASCKKEAEKGNDLLSKRQKTSPKCLVLIISEKNDAES